MAFFRFKQAVVVFLSAASLFLSTSVWSAKPLVVASIRPLALLVEDLGGDHVEVKTLIGGAVSPHDFSMTIGQASMLNDADILVRVGPSFEVFLNRGVTIERALVLDEQHHDHGHHQGAGHLWLSSDEALAFSDRIAAELVLLLPDTNAAIEKNLAQLKTNITNTHERIKQSLSPYRQREFAVYHDAYGELVSDYLLQAPLALTQVPHERVSAKRVNTIGQQIVSASCLLVEKDATQEAARFGKLFDVKVVPVDLLATDKTIGGFSDYMARVGDSFLQCFE